MPKGPLGGPRLTTLGPLSSMTEEEIKAKWDDCPESGKEREICRSIKRNAIRLLKEKYDSLVHINEGGCSIVAAKVFTDVEGIRIYEIGIGEHVWIYYEGKHYDAEKPTGVDDFSDLPIFSRVPLEEILIHTREELEMRGEEELPETVDDTVEDITNKVREVYT